MVGRRRKGAVHVPFFFFFSLPLFLVVLVLVVVEEKGGGAPVGLGGREGVAELVALVLFGVCGLYL